MGRLASFCHTIASLQEHQARGQMGSAVHGRTAQRRAGQGRWQAWGGEPATAAGPLTAAATRGAIIHATSSAGQGIGYGALTCRGPLWHLQGNPSSCRAARAGQRKARQAVQSRGSRVKMQKRNRAEHAQSGVAMHHRDAQARLLPAPNLSCARAKPQGQLHLPGRTQHLGRSWAGRGQGVPASQAVSYSPLDPLLICIWDFGVLLVSGHTFSPVARAVGWRRPACEGTNRAGGWASRWLQRCVDTSDH